jgi:hypothetical protein
MNAKNSAARRRSANCFREIWQDDCDPLTYQPSLFSRQGNVNQTRDLAEMEDMSREIQTEAPDYFCKRQAT